MNENSFVNQLNQVGYILLSVYYSPPFGKQAPIFPFIMSKRPAVKTEVYQKLKLWDQKRIQSLKYHRKAAEQLTEALCNKYEQSRDFLVSIETMLQERISQLRSYCASSVINSDLTLEKNKNEAYAGHYQLLKALHSIEAGATNQHSDKLAQLEQILAELQDYSEDSDEQQSQPAVRKCTQDEQIAVCRTNIRYMLDSQLPEIIDEVMKLGQSVSKCYNQNLESRDLFIEIGEFVRSTYRQTKKHKQIGKQILLMLSKAIRRQTIVQYKLQQCLSKWSEIDGPIQPTFLSQLMKPNLQQIITDYYNLAQLTTISYQQPTLNQFLLNFTIDDYSQHQRLKVFQVQALYNNSIDSIIIITVDGHMHLTRMNVSKPDFSLVLNKELVVRRKGGCGLEFVQWRSKYYFAREVEYRFGVEFGQEGDLLGLKLAMQGVSQCQFE